MTEDADLFIIGEREGYARQVGVMVSILQSSRSYLLKAARELSVQSLDAQPARATNTVGSILAHLNAAERLMQVITFDGRRWNDEESERYRSDFELRDSRMPRGRPLQSFLDALDETRARTLAEMRSRTDSWLAESRSFAKRPANNHYFWIHYVQDEARHTGQIILIRKYLLDPADPDFEPYFPS